MASRHDLAKDLFLRALDQPAADRAAYLQAACGDDDGLRQDVESLLAYHEEEPASAAGPSTDTASRRFAPGEVFASRYRMIARLGRGGMGDVWRADDLVLQTPVALKFIRSASADARASIINEVRLARQITHPAVCRVFDVSEADGEVFFTMELVRGEDLASLLRHVGRLPSDKVIDIAHQLCAGLSVAHAQGVLHRDLKPANILIDDDGLVRITDFGIAVTGTRVGVYAPVGTPGYMAPEQLVPAGPMSPQTDLYALGLVLYELLAGRLPFTAVGSQPERPSTLAPHVSPQLERSILKALSPDPRDRPESAAAFAASLPPPGGVRAHDRRLWIAGALASLVVAAVTLWLFLTTRHERAFTEQDVIVLADFTNSTGEPVFDGTLKVALAVALEQSPFLKVFPDERVRQTLRLMDRPQEATITRAIAREIAQRERLKALLTGSIASLGRNYVLALEAINAQTGDVIAREQVEANGKEQVLTSLGQAASRLRGKLGESLASIQEFDVPLPRATTPSLEALHAYALALDQDRLIARLGAVPHLRRAIELDPNFALAHALLSGIYANTRRSAVAPEFAARAFQLRDRVSERERYFISWRYFHDATQDWDSAFDLARSWATNYPRDAFAFNSLGAAQSVLGQDEESIRSFREALRLDPMFIAAHENLAGILITLNRFDEAREVVRQAIALRADRITLHRHAYVLAFIDGDAAAMAREAETASRVPDAVSASNWPARASAFAGRVQSAHEQFRRAIQLAVQADFAEMAAQWSVEDAEIHAIAGQCAEAREEVSAAFGLSRDNFTLERGSRALALCGAGGEASRVLAELGDRFPKATLTRRIQVPVANAALLSERGDAARVLDTLEGVGPYDHARGAEFWPPYLRGRALLQLKQGEAAALQFQSIVDRRGEAPDSPLYPLALLGLARATALADDRARAREWYDRFFAVWKDADASLRPLQDARREIERLR